MIVVVEVGNSKERRVEMAPLYLFQGLTPI